MTALAVHVDVYTALDNSSIRRSANEIQRDLQQAGDAGGRALSQGVEANAEKVSKALDKAANAAGRVRVEQEKYNKVLDEYNKAAANGEGDRAKLITHYERLATAQRNQSSAVRDVSNAMRDMDGGSSAATNAMRQMESAGSAATASVSGLSKAVTGLGAAGPAVAVVGIAALGVAVVDLAGVAASAAQSILLLPAAAGAAGAAFGTLQLATAGFGDAIKAVGDPQKFGEALRQLAPSAQQAALSIQSLMPEFEQLKNATQDALFAGVGQQLNQLANQYLPSIQAMTTGIAGAFNSMFSGVADQLMTPATQNAIQEFMTNVTQAFQNLAPAVAPLTKAFADLMSVGSSFLPDLAKGASDAAQAFSTFITQARQSGDLQKWMSEGLTTLKQLGSIAYDVGRAFIAMAPAGERILPKIVDAVKWLADHMPQITITAEAITEATLGWQPALKAAEAGIGSIQWAFEKIEPVVDRIGDAINGALAPLKALAEFAGVPIPDASTTKGGGAGRRGGGGFVSKDGSPTAGIPGFPGGGYGLPYAGAGRGVLGQQDAIHRGLHPGGYHVAGTDIPVTAPTGGSSGSTLPTAPVTPYDTSLPPGFEGLPQSASLYSAQSSYMDANTKLAEKQARLTQLEKSNTAGAEDIQKARNDVITAERDQHEAELRLYAARDEAFKKNTTQMNGYADQMGEIGAKLDQDLGISKGLPGIAENLFKFLANLAAAPLEGQLQAISNADPRKGGFGLMGVLGAQGAFGPQFTGLTASSAMGPAAFGGGMGAGGFSDAALLANVPSGSYSNSNTNLVKGLGDCSSAVGDLVNIMEGNGSGPSAGERLNTGNAASWLPAHGFMPGMGGPGDFRVGYNSGHMQATLPGGTNFNWGSDAAAAAGGVGPNAGAGAFEPGFTDHYYLPVGAGPGGDPYGAPAYTSPSPVTDPGLTNPTPTGWGAGGLGGTPAGAGGQGFGAGLTPGMAGQAAGTQIGAAVDPAGGTGKGGVGLTPGGTLDTAISAAASGLDLIAPGAGQAAQTGIKLANRAIQYGGQVAGIGVQGLMQTLLPTGGSELANNSWLTKGIGALAGAAPALPNMAGKAAAPPAQQGQQGQTGAGGGDTHIPITVNNNRPTEDGTGRDIAWNMQAMYSPAGKP